MENTEYYDSHHASTQARRVNSESAPTFPTNNAYQENVIDCTPSHHYDDGHSQQHQAQYAPLDPYPDDSTYSSDPFTHSNPGDGDLVQPPVHPRTPVPNGPRHRSDLSAHSNENSNTDFMNRYTHLYDGPDSMFASSATAFGDTSRPQDWHNRNQIPNSGRSSSNTVTPGDTVAPSMITAGHHQNGNTTQSTADHAPEPGNQTSGADSGSGSSGPVTTGATVVSSTTKVHYHKSGTREAVCECRNERREEPLVLWVNIPTTAPTAKGPDDYADPRAVLERLSSVEKKKLPTEEMDRLFFPEAQKHIDIKRVKQNPGHNDQKPPGGKIYDLRCKIEAILPENGPLDWQVDRTCPGKLGSLESYRRHILEVHLGLKRNEMTKETMKQRIARRLAAADTTESPEPGEGS